MTGETFVMEALGLSYDYANMTLPQVVQAYMDDMGCFFADCFLIKI